MAEVASYMRNFLSVLDSERVTVRVGKNTDSKVSSRRTKRVQLSHTLQDFSLPKDLLCSRSQWFKSALHEGHFQEGITKTIELCEDLRAVFELFVFHLYQGELAFSIDKEEVCDRPSSARGGEFVLLANLWIFSEKYLLSDLLNCAMGRICRLLDSEYFYSAIPDQTLAAVFSMVRDDCPIRTAIADYVVERLEADGSNLQSFAGLAGCSGFLQALHDSEAAFHNLPSQDFPRYRKRSKFAWLFRADQIDVKEQESKTHAVYDGDWSNSAGEPCYQCHACGFRDYYWVARCKDCVKSHCTCEPRHLKIICMDCM